MEVPIEKLREKIEGGYQLVIVAARRTRQLADGAPKLVDVKSAKKSTLALWEIASGKIKYKKQEKKEG